MKSLTDQLQIDESAFVAPNATVVGDVHLAEYSSVWYGAVLRGDSDSIRIGKRTNIQDNAVVHIDPGFPVLIGDDCIIGHGAIVHGAQLANNVLIGMNAVVLNGAKIGAYCIIGANALVTAGMEIAEGSLVLGSPAKVVKQLTTEQKRSIEKNAEVYVDKAKEFKQLLGL